MLNYVWSADCTLHLKLFTFLNFNISHLFVWQFRQLISSKFINFSLSIFWETVWSWIKLRTITLCSLIWSSTHNHWRRLCRRWLLWVWLQLLTHRCWCRWKLWECMMMMKTHFIISKSHCAHLMQMLQMQRFHFWFHVEETWEIRCSHRRRRCRILRWRKDSLTIHWTLWISFHLLLLFAILCTTILELI